jgi:hypothetical protein
VWASVCLMCALLVRCVRVVCASGVCVHCVA